jgi:hypothetical protein
VLKLERLPPSPGTARGVVSGYCRPGHLAADARAHARAAQSHAQRLAPASRRADSVLLGLLLLLALAACVRCAPAHPVAAEAHNHTTEHAAPVNTRGWHEVDTSQE